jgi:transcriptional regulator with XRE-family HTH domain
MACVLPTYGTHGSRTRYALNVVSYAPLYIHSFRLVQAHTLVEAEKFNLHYTDPSQIDNIADKLRWYRYQHGLLQRDVADYAGLDRTAHMPDTRIPCGTTTPSRRCRDCELFAVPVTDLLDEFNLFLYHGQGQQIKEMRRRRQMTQAEYARRLGVPFGTLQAWEQDRVQICKQTWRRLKIRG